MHACYTSDADDGVQWHYIRFGPSQSGLGTIKSPIRIRSRVGLESHRPLVRLSSQRSSSRHKVPTTLCQNSRLSSKEILYSGRRPKTASTSTPTRRRPRSPSSPSSPRCSTEAPKTAKRCSCSPNCARVKETPGPRYKFCLKVSSQNTLFREEREREREFSPAPDVYRTSPQARTTRSSSKRATTRRGPETDGAGASTTRPRPCKPTTRTSSPRAPAPAPTRTTPCA